MASCGSQPAEQGVPFQRSHHVAGHPAQGPLLIAVKAHRHGDVLGVEAAVATRHAGPLEVRCDRLPRHTKPPRQPIHVLPREIPVDDLANLRHREPPDASPKSDAPPSCSALRPPKNGCLMNGADTPRAVIEQMFTEIDALIEGVPSREEGGCLAQLSRGVRDLCRPRQTPMLFLFVVIRAAFPTDCSHIYARSFTLRSSIPVFARLK